ncbi:hypothetical protein CYMTET_49052 [Cymbomonas tetramitiformis]|uniref:Uncharacterized protein n=1 Tax=Cymbomonas tetramitiformis TaxID=36881 RepID=A0AAE0EU99_9CHLO|nr:hypothetical protein CYMTET_49052 [Cymbomonas tetramitiformis]
MKDAICGHQENRLTTGGDCGASEFDAGLAQDGRLQEEQKRRELQNEVECASWHLTVRLAADCVLKDKERREAFLKRRAAQRQHIMTRVADYAKREAFLKRQAAQRQHIMTRVADYAKREAFLKRRAAQRQHIMTRVADYAAWHSSRASGAASAHHDACGGLCDVRHSSRGERRSVSIPWQRVADYARREAFLKAAAQRLCHDAWRIRGVRRPQEGKRRSVSTS